MARLKKGDVTIAEMLLLSRKLYKSERVDNKAKRAKLDIIGGKVTSMNNFTYDASTRSWKTIAGRQRSVKLEFIVSSSPVSYKKTDTIAVHKYPITLVLFSIEAGLSSSFKFRSGSFKKPLFAPQGCSSEKRLKITNQNIKNGVDLSFFFLLEYVCNVYGLLYGPNYAKWAPKQTNPTMLPFFDKHVLFVVTKLLPRILNNPQLKANIKNKNFTD
jgi:hypothetical protein